jgi:hypothetical protein
MKKLSKPGPQKEVGKDRATITVGLDLGDRFSHYCVLNEEGDVIEEGRTPSTDVAWRRHFPPRRVCAWRWSAVRTHPGSAGC